ncbi:hypothetical protein VPHD528_0153 [Vibrio phage D528]
MKSTQETYDALNGILRSDPNTVRDFWKSGFNPLQRNLNTQSPAFKAMQELVGGKYRTHIAYPLSHKRSAIGMSDHARDILFPKASEVTVMLLYPSTIRKLYGGVVLNGYRIGDIIDSLRKLRKEFKVDARKGSIEADILQAKAKALICVIYGVLVECVTVPEMDDASLKVVIEARHTMENLFDVLVDKGFTPMYSDTDSFMLAEAPCPELNDALYAWGVGEGLSVDVEQCNNLVINRIKRYIHTGAAGSTIQGYRLYQAEKQIGRADNRRTLNVRNKVIDDMKRMFHLCDRLEHEG